MIAFMRERSAANHRFVPLTAALVASVLCGCGGQMTDTFVNAVYVTIQNDGTPKPTTLPASNGYRIVFVNNDSVAHTVHWNTPINLNGTAQPGDRVWFELPFLLTGTIVSYHLDASGPGGTVTIMAPQ